MPTSVGAACHAKLVHQYHPESSRISEQSIDTLESSEVNQRAWISEQSIDTLESSEFNPRAYHSDSLQSTIYDPPTQSTTVSLKHFSFKRNSKLAMYLLTLNDCLLHIK